MAKYRSTAAPVDAIQWIPGYNDRDVQALGVEFIAEGKKCNTPGASGFGYAEMLDWLDKRRRARCEDGGDGE